MINIRDYTKADLEEVIDLHVSVIKHDRVYKEGLSYCWKCNWGFFNPKSFDGNRGSLVNSPWDGCNGFKEIYEEDNKILFENDFLTIQDFLAYIKIDATV